MAVFVKPGESIQQAINSSPPGTEVVLAAGTWREHVVIDKSLTLRGAESGKSIIRGRVRDRSVIAVCSSWQSANDVTIDRLTVTGADTTAGRWVFNAGILAHGDPRFSLRLSLTRNEIHGNTLCGVLLDGSVQAAIANCQIVDNARGIRASDSAHATVSECAVSARALGVQITGSARLDLRDCVVKAEGSAFIAGQSARLSMTQCDVGSESYGAGLSDSSRTVMNESRFRSRDGSIDLSGTATAEFNHCELSTRVCVTGGARLNLDGGILINRADKMDGVIVCGGHARIRGTAISVDGCAIGALGGRVTIEDCSISRSTLGLVCASDAWVSMFRSKVILCDECAVSFWGERFAGLVRGSENTIPGLGEASANVKCFELPADLGFLTTKRGGFWSGSGSQSRSRFMDRLVEALE